MYIFFDKIQIKMKVKQIQSVCMCTKNFLNSMLFKILKCAMGHIIWGIIK